MLHPGWPMLEVIEEEDEEEKEDADGGYVGYHLNRNRNSRSVLGIDYTIAHVRPCI